MFAAGGYILRMHLPFEMLAPRAERDRSFGAVKGPSPPSLPTGTQILRPVSGTLYVIGNNIADR